jgi:hypothetical protein
MADDAPLVPFGTETVFVDPDSGAPFLTVAELATWTRQEIVADDPFALVVIDAASLRVREAASQPTWTLADIPKSARLIAIQLAKRTYLNPDAIVAEGGLGPIGGDRFIEDFARTLELTEYERATLEGLAPAGAIGKGSRLWVQETTRGDLETAVDVYYFDNSGSDWAIPMYADVPVIP